MRFFLFLKEVWNNIGPKLVSKNNKSTQTKKNHPSVLVTKCIYVLLLFLKSLFETLRRSNFVAHPARIFFFRFFSENLVSAFCCFMCDLAALCDMHPMRALFLIPRNPAPRLKSKKWWEMNWTTTTASRWEPFWIFWLPNEVIKWPKKKKRYTQSTPSYFSLVILTWNARQRPG